MKIFLTFIILWCAICKTLPFVAQIQLLWSPSPLTLILATRDELLYLKTRKKLMKVEERPCWFAQTWKWWTKWTVEKPGKAANFHTFFDLEKTFHNFEISKKKLIIKKWSLCRYWFFWSGSLHASNKKIKF